MQKRIITAKINRLRSGRKHRGFTLTELIVVLAIVAILSVAGVATAFGYIKKSNFERNSQNAVSVYEAAQNALSMKLANGTMDSWTEALIDMNYSEEEKNNFIKDLDVDNESNTVVFSLTYNPNSSANTEDSFLYKLLSDQFYDKSIFQGTMAIEINVVATYSKGKVYYSSWVLSAFYCLQNDAETGWSDLCVDGSEDHLPKREPYSYRRNTSLVGWYDGSELSVKGPDGVNPVQIPQTLVSELDGHILADSTDTGFLFNLRNGETLDVSWAIFDYDGIIREDHNEENFKISFKTEGLDKGNSEDYNTIELKISKDNLDAFRSSVENRDWVIVNENVNSKNITRYTKSGTIIADIESGSFSKTDLIFPITITKVIGDDRVGCPDENVGYYEYRLSLDCMMVRGDESITADSRYNAERLFGTTPRNISATFSGTFTHYVETDKSETKTLTDIKAARAIDDPVYFTGVSKVQDKTTYCYMVREGVARFDGSDDPEAGTTGQCVVNTLFGDLIYNDSIAATSWTDEGGNAVITSFRHLYNIRWITSGTVNYRIVRDLNWYVNEPGLLNVSDVRVYNHNNGEFNSPGVTKSVNATSTLKVVSFPAFNELRSNQTISSVSNSEGNIVKINNLQMRVASFIDGTDLGYGLFCTNNGTIANIYTNNFNLILAPVSDGSENDYGLISKTSTEIVTSSNTSLNKSYYVGGLVGVNHGNIGDSTAEKNENVIMMSNPVIMTSSDTSDYWKSGPYQGAAAIIGKNEGSDVYSPAVSGSLTVNGNFAVVGYGNVGAAIAFTNADVGARIVIDGDNLGTSEFTFPVESTTDSPFFLSCVITGTDNVGGAIGYMQKCELDYAVSEKFTEDDASYNSTTGKISFKSRNDDDYQIYVDLPKNSLLLELDDNADLNAIGGAIGYLEDCQGTYDYMSIYVNNLGNILIRNKNSNSNETGGVIGHDIGNSISTTYIKANNNCAIGSFLDSSKDPENYSEHCGGVYGLIESPENRTIVMDVVNNNTIISSFSGDNGDNQGAGGAIGTIKDGNITLIADIFNDSDTDIVHYSSNYYQKNTGAGGVIGSLSKDNSTYLNSGSHIYVENNGYIYANYSAGGAVGMFSLNYGDIYAYNNGATISGKYDVGGAVGWSKNGEFGLIQSILSDATVSGIDYIGGAVGRLPDFRDAKVITKVYGSSTVSGTGSLVGGVCGEFRIQGNGTGLAQLTGDGSLSVTADGDGVGGVAGVLRSNITNSVTVKVDGVILNVSGNNCVGGAIGKLRSTTFGNSDDYANADTTKFLNNDKSNTTISINADIVLPQSSRITGNYNVGGAIGFVHTNNGTFNGTVNVRSVSGSSEDVSYIGGLYNVGGAIGHFGSMAPDKYDSSGIYVDFSESPLTIKSTTSDSGEANLGGAVGFFDSDTNAGYDDCEFVIDVKLGDSSVSANGSNVGGAIGKNTIKNGNISVSFSGTITGNNNVGGGIGNNGAATTSVNVTAGGSGSAEIKGAGNNVGGAVGYNYKKIKSVSAVLTGGTSVTGIECVGGSIGLLESESTSVTASISGDSFVEGNINIGGAIGRVAAESANIYDLSVTATINSNYAVRGNSNLGGAVGRIGSDSSSTKALTINSISVVANAGVPIKQGDSQNTDACIGGVVGYHHKGTISSISLSGSGGFVNTLSGSGNSVAPYKTYDNGMLITGKGNYLGGIIGKSGGSNASGDAQTNSKLGDISATGPAICVISSDNSNYIGGWIGGCYSTIGGADNNNKKTYDVSTVKVVFSKAEFVAGVCGTFNRASTSTNVYMIMKVAFSEAIISGRAAVGGAFGELSGVLLYGRLDMTLEKGTRIGDYRGDLGDGTDEEIDVEGCYCVEAGGIAGRYSIMNGQNTNGKISLTISEDEELSMIFAGGDDYTGINDYANNPMQAETAGVGGVFGRVKAYGNNTGYTIGNGNCTYDAATQKLEAYAYLISSSRNVAVFAYASNAGGFVGYLPNGTIRGCFSTAVVKAEGQNACAGGFVGRMEKGTIGNSFCGGHTVGGQYIPLYENIVGKNNVGGFAGYIGADVSSIYQCYSTASVRGENYVGGFAGYINGTKSKLIEQDYCTGYVFAVTSEDDTEERYYGSFAGYVIGASDAPFLNSKVVEAINKDKKIVGNINASINSGKLMLAKWNGTGNNYIRINASSIYHKTAFDSVLQSDDVKFPLRTFVSVQVNGKWEGIHYGDWPIIPKEQPEYILTEADVDFAPDAATVFSGSLVEPEVIVTKNNKVLDPDTCYSVVYWRNNKIGKATAIIVGTDPYYGIVTKTFDISSANINSPQFTINVTTNLPYNDGEPVKPDVVITYTYKNRVTTLVENKDYTLTYENNIEPGQAKVKITGIGNYIGEVEKEFTILPLFMITFEAGGETVYEPQRIVKYDVVQKPADPTLTGHTFDGWYTNEECTGTPYDFTSKVESDLTLYAKWVIDTFEVKFVSNGGVDIDPITIEYGKTINEDELPEQIKTDYTFMGWYTDEQCTEKYDFATPVTGGFTLYALWKLNPTVTFECNGGTAIDPVKVDYNTPVSEPEDPTKENFTFLGWYSDENYQNSYDFDTNVTEDIKLYAKWAENPIVTFIIDSTNTVEMRVPYNSDLESFAPDVADKVGQEFAGWYADQACSEEYELKDKVTANVTIYAKWINIYTVVLITGEGATQYDPQTVKEGDTLDLDPAVPTRDGYDFDGWFTTDAFTNPIDIDSLSITFDRTIYAKWQKRPIVSFYFAADDIVEKTVPYNTDQLATYIPDIPEKDGYVFDDWYADQACTEKYDFADNVTSDVTIYAKWIKTYTVEFITGEGATQYNTQTVNEGDKLILDPATPSKEGFEFKGWYTDAAHTEPIDISNQTIDKNYKLYADWEEKQTTP